MKGQDDILRFEDNVTNTLQGAKIGLWVLTIKDGKQALYVDETMRSILEIPETFSPYEVDNYLNERVYKEDITIFIDYGNRLFNDTRAECEYRWNHPTKGLTTMRCGGWRDRTISDYILIRGYHSDITEIKQNNEKMQKALDNEKKVTDVLVGDYNCVYKINIVNDTFEVFEMNDIAKRFIESSGIASQQNDIVCKQMIAQEYKEKYREFVNLNTLPKRLFEKKKITLEYLNNFFGWTEGTFYSLEKDENGYATKVLYTTKSVDDEKKKELVAYNTLKRVNDQLEQQLQVTGSISSIYFMIYSLNIKTGLYEEIAAKDRIHNVVARVGIAKEQVTFVADYLVKEKYKKELMEFCDLTTLGDRLYGKKMVTTEFESKHDNWVRAILIPQEYDNNGSLLKALFIVRNINEEKAKEIKYQDDLKSALDSAKLANQSKTDFLSRMSHDIRTPINGIIGMLEILQKNLDDRNRVLDCVGKMETASNYLLSLIKDVLDMNKLESGTIELSEEPFNLCDLLMECINIYSGQAIERGVKVNYEQNYFEGYNDLLGSPVHLKQIFVNILSNSIKYNKPQGSVFMKMELLDHNDEMVKYRFTLEDTGIGMSEEFLNHLFEPFTQEHHTARTTLTGSGLGMSIVKKLIDLMGGDIKVESTVNVGSKFVIELPFKINKNVEKSDEETEMENKIDVNGMKVLLVEDNELNMEIAEYMLNELGVKVTKAFNGQEAIDEFSKSKLNHFNVILMDMMMPVKDGITATREIREMDRVDAKIVPIIAMTANAFSEDVKKCISNGMNAHISKPVDSKTLVKTLAKFYYNR